MARAGRGFKEKLAAGVGDLMEASLKEGRWVAAGSKTGVEALSKAKIAGEGALTDDVSAELSHDKGGFLMTRMEGMPREVVVVVERLLVALRVKDAAIGKASTFEEFDVEDSSLGVGGGGIYLDVALEGVAIRVKKDTKRGEIPGPHSKGVVDVPSIEGKRGGVEKGV